MIIMKKNFKNSKEFKRILKEMGFCWSKVDELKEENEKLKQKIKTLEKENIPQIDKKLCFECIHCQEFKPGDVTFIGEPPKPYCRRGNFGFPTIGEECFEFTENIGKTPWLPEPIYFTSDNTKKNFFQRFWE